MNTLHPLVTISLPDIAYQYAQKFADEQANPDKTKQVYRNTLAGYAVYEFLDYMEFAPVLDQSDAWHPVIRAFNNVADVVIPDLGKVECRPILPEETSISIPPEVSEQRLAYVAVKLSDNCQEAELIGFVKGVTLLNLEVSLSELTPIDLLIDYLENLAKAKEFLESDEPIAMQVRQKMADQNREIDCLILAQLELIYRQFDQPDQRLNGGKVLHGPTKIEMAADSKYQIKSVNAIAPAQLTQTIAFRSVKKDVNNDMIVSQEVEAMPDRETQRLATKLLEELGKIWDKTQ